jgi:hypothetical protein
MYYIIEYDRNPYSKAVDQETIVVTRSPATHPTTGEEVIEGHVITWNDVPRYAHGEYDSIEKAREAVSRIFGECRELDEPGHCDAVLEFKLGALEPWDRESTESWLYDGLSADINANDTDEELEELGEYYRKAAASDGVALHEDLFEILNDYREMLQEEMQGE